MTTSSEQNPSAEGARWRQVLLWLGHQYGRYNVPALGLLLATNIGQLWLPENGLRNALGNVSMAAAVSYVGLSMVRDKFHGRVLCRRCLDEAPWLDPQGEVNKHARQLRLWHSPRRPHLLWGILAAFIVTTLFASAAAGHHHLLPMPQWVGATISSALYLGVLGTMMVVFTALDQHKRLRPWCPDCRNGGRGPRTRPTVGPRPQPVAGR